MRARELRKLLSLVAREAQAENQRHCCQRWKIRARAVVGRLCWGYREAIYDVIAMMDHGEPADQRGFWQRARSVATVSRS